MIPFAILLLAVAQPTGSTELDCDDTSTQHELNRCAAIEYEQADAELNRVWGELRKLMQGRDEAVTDGRPSSWQVLRRAQQSWIEFRDAHCRLEGYDARGGSMEPLLVSNCLERLTRARVEQLEALQTNQISGEPKRSKER